MPQCKLRGKTQPRPCICAWVGKTLPRTGPTAPPRFSLQGQARQHPVAISETLCNTTVRPYKYTNMSSARLEQLTLAASHSPVDASSLTKSACARRALAVVRIGAGTGALTRRWPAHTHRSHLTRLLHTLTARKRPQGASRGPALD